MADGKPQHRAYSRDMDGVLVELKYGGLVSCSCCDMEFKEKKSQEYADIIEAELTADRKRFEETLDGYTKDWAEQKRGFQKRIEELEKRPEEIYEGELEAARKHLCEAAEEINCAGRIPHRIRILKKELGQKIADQTAEIKRLREVLRQIQDYCDLGLTLFLHSNRWEHLVKLVDDILGGETAEDRWGGNRKALDAKEE